MYESKAVERFDSLKLGRPIELIDFSQWKYSDAPEKLRKLLKLITVTASIESLQRRYFTGETDKRTVLNIAIKRGSQSVTFEYGCSLYDTELFTVPSYNPGDSIKFRGVQYFDRHRFNEVLREAKAKFIGDLLYDILCSCRNDYHCPIDFDEFCAEYGENNDSIRAKAQWEDCLKQSAKVNRIFSDDDYNCLPG